MIFQRVQDTDDGKVKFTDIECDLIETAETEGGSFFMLFKAIPGGFETVEIIPVAELFMIFDNAELAAETAGQKLATLSA